MKNSILSSYHPCDHQTCQEKGYVYLIVFTLPSGMIACQEHYQRWLEQENLSAENEANNLSPDELAFVFRAISPRRPRFLT